MGFTGRKYLRIEDKPDYNTYHTSVLKRSRYAAKKAKAKSIKSVVREELRRAKVPKMVTTIQASNTFNSSLGAADAYTLLSGIAKGTDDYQRDGDSIALRRIQVQGNVGFYNPFATNTNQSWLTVMMLYCKSAPQASSANIPWNSLLDTNGAYTNWSGIATDRFLDINTDDFGVLYRKDIKMSQVQAFTAGVLNSAENDSGSQNYCQFSIDVPFKDKHVEYEAGLNIPSLFNPFMCFAVTNGDPTGNAVAGTTVIVSYVSKVIFVDDN